jgi:hypothetical protein
MAMFVGLILDLSERSEEDDPQGSGQLYPRAVGG